MDRPQRAPQVRRRIMCDTASCYTRYTPLYTVIAAHDAPIYTSYTCTYTYHTSKPPHIHPIYTLYASQRRRLQPRNGAQAGRRAGAFVVKLVKIEIQKLPSRCKETFLLSKQEGLTIVEIADFMNVSTRTVETQMSKAYKILREKLKDKIQPILFLLFGLDPKLKTTMSVSY